MNDFKLSDEFPLWLRDRIILLTVTGSHLYGTNTPTSDIDYKGVCIPTENYFYGLDIFNEYNNTGGKNWKNTIDDVDVAISHICKFVKECSQGVPNTLEILFTREEDIVRTNEFGRALIANRNDFISKAIKHKFSGYAHSQIQKMIAKKSNGSGRKDLVELYEYDTKFFSHAVRLYTMAIEILSTGTFTAYRSNREELLACKNGKYTLEQAIVIVNDLDKELNELYATSNVVPHSPDYNKINNWLIELVKEALSVKW